MRFWGRAFFVLAAVFGCSWNLRALTVSYGSFFEVSGVVRAADKVLLPLTRGKYANIRVLTRETLDVVKNCSESCVQDAGAGEIKIEDFRAAKTSGGMWIADVSVDGRWLITFLIFQNKNGYGIKPPDEVQFLDKILLVRTERALAALADEFRAQEEYPL
ncbi:MAG: hypothetical protein ACI351_00080 [Candidatus Avelusimicrobium sp.]|uniref:hypothetical protein n=1 Tax=Candidatus Avelusimicrobium sp. TaxID=3048833 RepID=UPI003F04D861